MPHASRPIGISALTPTLPRLRLDLRAWCRWTGRDEGKVTSVTGTGFRMPGPREDALTLAAAAVMRLVRTGTVDPDRVGFLALATESARDGAVGAVIVKGLVDQALRAEGRPPLARECEVPEFKQACLAGIYAMKAAARWLAWDGRGRQAIVVASDVASYALGSTGEPTQGAGAVAALLEEDPDLLVLDLDASAGTSAFRGADFRKPVLRHFLARNGTRPRQPEEYPVFDGPWSTACYLDETLRAVEALAGRLQTDVGGILAQTSLAFFHRPYRKMPRDALALLRLQAMVQGGGPSVEALCQACGADPGAVRAELRDGPRPGTGGDRGWPAASKARKFLRDGEDFRREADTLLAAGEARMAECGNLYAASILAWAAAGLEEVALSARDLANDRILFVGYGSGDAADASLMRVADRWREAALRSGFATTLANPVDLDREGYEALHEGRPSARVPDMTSDGFAVDHVGWSACGRADSGVEHYSYRPGC